MPLPSRYNLAIASKGLLDIARTYKLLFGSSANANLVDDPIRSGTTGGSTVTTLTVRLLSDIYYLPSPTRGCLIFSECSICSEMICFSSSGIQHLKHDMKKMGYRLTKGMITYILREMVRGGLRAIVAGEARGGVLAERKPDIQVWFEAMKQLIEGDQL